MLIKNLTCMRCNVAITKIAEVAKAMHGDAMQDAGTIEIKCTVGSRFEGLILTGVVCDDCVAALSALQGTMVYVAPNQQKPGEISAVDWND